MSKDYPPRWRTMLKYIGINNSHVSKETGLSYSHVRDSVVPQNFNKWCRFTVYVFEKDQEEISELKREIAELKEELLKEIVKEFGENEQPVSELQVKQGYDFTAKDIYTGTAPPIKYDEEAVNKAIKDFKPKDNE